MVNKTITENNTDIPAFRFDIFSKILLMTEYFSYLKKGSKTRFIGLICLIGSDVRKQRTEVRCQ